jgi:hypothetical protein
MNIMLISKYTAGATAFTSSRKPPQLILDGFKQRGFPCKSYDVVQPISMHLVRLRFV